MEIANSVLQAIYELVTYIEQLISSTRYKAMGWWVACNTYEVWGLHLKLCKATKGS